MDYETGVRLDLILNKVEHLAGRTEYLIDELEKTKKKQG